MHVCVCVCCHDAARLACQTACITFVTYFGSECVFFMRVGDVAQKERHTHTQLKSDQDVQVKVYMTRSHIGKT